MRYLQDEQVEPEDSVTGSLASISETAKTLGVSTFTIRRLIVAGDLKAVHVGARIMIPTTEVDRVIAYGVGRPRPRRRKSGAR
jgi:excisionase family DNA binding protein